MIRIGSHEAGGVEIELDGDDVARAISAYLVANGINVQGPRTIRLDEEPEKGAATAGARVYVDPSGFVEDAHTRVTIEGRDRG